MICPFKIGQLVYHKLDGSYRVVRGYDRYGEVRLSGSNITWHTRYIRALTPEEKGE